MRWSIVGPMHGMMTGQSRVTLTVANIINQKHKVAHCINTNFEGLRIGIKTIKTLRILMQFIISLKSTKAYYISIKRGPVSVFLDLILIVIARIFFKKIVLHLHGNEVFNREHLNSFFYQCLIRLNLSMAHKVICLNSYQFNELKKFGLMNVYIVHNFTDLPSALWADENKYLKEERIRIVFLSNFQEQKGFLTFLQLFEKYPNIDFSLCGKFLSNQSKEKLYFDKMDISSLHNVDYHGFIDGKEKANVLNKSHFIFFVSTYPTEAQPLSLVEAMSQGCVPIVADRPYISDLVTSENGIVLSTNPGLDEIDSMIDKLSLFTYSQYFAKCQSIASEFTLNIFEDSITKVFSDDS